MNEMDVLKNRWREAKGTRTFPDIAEAADLSPSTVEYAFSPKSTNPSIDTVVRISRELHVSLDETFGILAPSGRAETELARQDASHWKSLEVAVRIRRPGYRISPHRHSDARRVLLCRCHLVCYAGSSMRRYRLLPRRVELRRGVLDGLFCDRRVYGRPLHHPCIPPPPAAQRRK